MEDRRRIEDPERGGGAVQLEGAEHGNRREHCPSGRNRATESSPRWSRAMRVSPRATHELVIVANRLPVRRSTMRADGAEALDHEPRRPGRRAGPDRPRARRRLDRMARQRRGRHRAVRRWRHHQPAGRDLALRARRLLSGPVQLDVLAALPRRRARAGVPPALVGCATSRSTGASLKKRRRSRRPGARSGFTTTSSSSFRRCCASSARTSASASSCTSRSHPPSCSGVYPGAKK